jgi:hypothetical protein
MKKSVYVDDNLATGPDKKELEAELEAIWKIVPGRKIPGKVSTDSQGREWTWFDFLGADLHYCREGKEFRLNMEHYIFKMIAKHKVQISKPVHSPNYDESAFVDPQAKVVPEYPFRQVVGELQWVATVARPDICVPVATLAKYVSQPATMPMVRACRKIMKYLATTADDGVTYSPEQEQQFEELYAPLLPEGRSIPRTNLFSDASFANCLKTMRSTSGSIMYFRSTPIAWRSSRQTVRAYSTSESEYIAASDTIVLSETNDYCSFFDPTPKVTVTPQNGVCCPSADVILWVDNTSAINVAQSEETRPKSRHYALRYLRVRDAAEKLVFCPTGLQRADGLTKLSCSVPQRRLLLHLHTPNNMLWMEEEDPEDDDDDPEAATAAEAAKAAEEANYSYLVYFGF